MEIVVALAAFAASLLTLFSGFGLGTLLTPVFGLFFPLHYAVALTGIVHLLNNLFKLSLFGHKADKKLVLHFGLPSVVGGFTGAGLLSVLSELPPLFSWQLGGKIMEVSALKLSIGLLMIAFAMMELIPKLRHWSVDPKYLRLGGLLSGFFGGLSGHQGALRSAFLIRSGLSKEVFIATGVLIACLVDFTRIPIYFSRFSDGVQIQDQWPILSIAVGSAFAGAYLGTRFLKKTTMRVVQAITTFMIVAIGLALALGLL